MSLDSTDADATVRGLVGSGTAFMVLEATGVARGRILALTSGDDA